MRGIPGSERSGGHIHRKVESRLCAPALVLALCDGRAEFAEVEISAAEPDDGRAGSMHGGLGDIVWISHGTNLEVKSSVDD